MTSIFGPGKISTRHDSWGPTFSYSSLRRTYGVAVILIFTIVMFWLIRSSPPDSALLRAALTLIFLSPWVIAVAVILSPRAFYLTDGGLEARYFLGKPRTWNMADLQVGPGNLMSNLLDATDVVDKDGRFQFRIWRTLDDYDRFVDLLATV